MERKTLIIVIAVIGILLGIYWFRKKSTKSNEEIIQSGVSNAILKGAEESIKTVEMSQEDEEYNLLRMEYSDRYGEAPKSSWSKAMIQQKIDEYDERSSLLDIYVQEAGNKDLESVSEMTTDEIMREIELAKQEAAQKLLTAQTTYQESMGKAAPAGIQSPEQLYAEIAQALSDAKKEYKDFTGSNAPSNCNTPVLVKQALSDAKKQMRDTWNRRKQEILNMAASTSRDIEIRAQIPAKRRLEANFNTALAYNEAEFYIWFEHLWKLRHDKNQDLGRELCHLRDSGLFYYELRIVAGKIISRRDTNYRLGMAIDEYGRYSA